MLGLAIGFLFYGNALALAASIPCAYGAFRLGAHKKSLAKRRELRGQLRDWLLAVTTALRSGFALENALIRGGEEIRSMYGEAAMMTGEAARMRDQVRLQMTPELLLKDFAERTGLEEGRELAQVLAVAKRQGGDYLPVLKAMAEAMDARRLVREETETLLAGQKLEYHIMCLVPTGILLYLKLTAPELICRLYTSGGRWFSTLVLLLYAAAFLAGDRVLEKSYGA